MEGKLRQSADVRLNGGWGSRSRTNGGLSLAQGKVAQMTVTILDPRTGARVTVTVPSTSRSEQRARRWVLRRLDRPEDRRNSVDSFNTR